MRRESREGLETRGEGGAEHGERERGGGGGGERERERRGRGRRERQKVRKERTCSSAGKKRERKTKKNTKRTDSHVKHFISFVKIPSKISCTKVLSGGGRFFLVS